MIILELICAAGRWVGYNILKPLIRFPYWLITARDCYHCEHREREVTKDIHGNCKYCDYCAKNDYEKCYNTECYNSITRRDFERDR